jgi:hypothetical protein
MELKKNAEKFDPNNGGEIMTKTQSNRWTVTLEEDADTGDLIMPIPQEVLDLQGWGEGDTLEWIDQGNGSWQLQKKSV